MRIPISSDCDGCLSHVDSPSQAEMTQHYNEFLLAQIHHQKQLMTRAMLYCRLGDVDRAYAVLSQAVNS